MTVLGYHIRRCDRGAAAVEFALAALPVLFFILGVIQTAWIVWVENLLQTSVNTAARCGAVQSTTLPCMGSNMIATANLIFGPLSGATFSVNASVTCPAGATGLVGTYNITFLFVIDMTVTAKSCYPMIS